MDAACHLLDLKMAVTVYEDPVFIPFTEPQTFSETEFLKKNVVINIKVSNKILEHGDSLTLLMAPSRNQPSINFTNIVINPFIMFFRYKLLWFIYDQTTIKILRTLKNPLIP